MSTAAVLIPIAPALAKSTGFVGFLKHIGHFAAIALKDIAIYAPLVAPLAGVLFPEATAIPAAALAAEKAAGLISSTVQVVQQKWAASAPGAETNVAKLADAVSIAEPAVIALLQPHIPNIDSDRVTAAINAAVAILNAQPAPVVKP